MLVMGVALSFWMNARLALIFVICAPVPGTDTLADRCAGWRPMYTRLQETVDHLNGVVQEGTDRHPGCERPLSGESMRKKSFRQ